MKRKRIPVAVVAALLVGGLWFARMGGPEKATAGVSVETAEGQARSGEPKPDQMGNRPVRLAPPNQTRRFKEYTPEQRVEFARKGHGPGG
jgi:hypothetical protein